jgi:hypothetical protein
VPRGVWVCRRQREVLKTRTLGGRVPIPFAKWACGISSRQFPGERVVARVNRPAGLANLWSLWRPRRAALARIAGQARPHRRSPARRPRGTARGQAWVRRWAACTSSIVEDFWQTLESLLLPCVDLRGVHLAQLGDLGNGLDVSNRLYGHLGFEDRTVLLPASFGSVRISQRLNALVNHLPVNNCGFS